MTALFESFSLTIILDVFSLSILTLLHFSRVGKPVLDSKSLHHKPFGPHRFLLISKQPWDSFSMDFIEELPLSDGHDTILVVVFCLTQMALFIPTFQDIDAEALAHILSQVFAKHGTPTDIISDWGKHFIS